MNGESMHSNIEYSETENYTISETQTHQSLETESEDVQSEDSDNDHDMIYDDDLPNFYDYRQVFPQLDYLRKSYEIILSEMKAVQNCAVWPVWPENHFASSSREWRVFPLCYTFPAHDASKTKWLEMTCAQCPQTVQILKGISGVRTALFSRLGPNTCLGAHRGWADLSNYILRSHLSLQVPEMPDASSSCAMVVGSETQEHKKGDILVFDDSKLHYAFNRHSTLDRVVLIVDLYRPEHIPQGRAIGGHTNELDEFIENFSRQDKL